MFLGARAQGKIALLELLIYTALKVFCQNVNFSFIREVRTFFFSKIRLLLPETCMTRDKLFIRVASDEAVCRAVEKKNASDMINEFGLFDDKRILAVGWLENRIDSVFCLITYASFYSTRYC